jgi:hypothetical protein
MLKRLRILGLTAGGVAAGVAFFAFSAAAVHCDVAEGPSELVPDAIANTGICVGVCRPDPGWGPVDCSPEQAVETFPIAWFDDQLADNDTQVGTHIGARDWYTYTDGTSPVFFGPIQATGGDAAFLGVPAEGGFQPPVTETPLCRPDYQYVNPNNGRPQVAHNSVLHIYGGQFLAWGGGMGIAMAKLNGREPYSQDTSANIDPLAPKNICRVNSPAPSPPCPPLDAEYGVLVGAMDVSQWEGVSFWARRSPNGQAGLRVLVGDKYTDDDLNYLAQRQLAADAAVPQPIYCSRVRECDCRPDETCQAFDPATLPRGYNAGLSPPSLSPIYGPDLMGKQQYCEKPFAPLAANTLPCVSFTSGAGPSNCCNQWNCDQAYAPFPNDNLPATGRFIAVAGNHGDVQFATRPCTPYTWPNGVGGSWCYDPATDPPPAASTEQCGDHWMTTVDVGTEWKFYTVPFTNLRQQGWAKRSYKLDLTAVSVVRFTWDAGYIDYWIDSVSFYRRKQ